MEMTRVVSSTYLGSAPVHSEEVLGPAHRAEGLVFPLISLGPPGLTRSALLVRGIRPKGEWDCHGQPVGEFGEGIDCLFQGTIHDVLPFWVGHSTGMPRTQVLGPPNVTWATAAPYMQLRQRNSPRSAHQAWCPLWQPQAVQWLSGKMWAMQARSGS